MLRCAGVRRQNKTPFHPRHKRYVCLFTSFSSFPLLLTKHRCVAPPPFSLPPPGGAHPTIFFLPPQLCSFSFIIHSFHLPPFNVRFANKTQQQKKETVSEHPTLHTPHWHTHTHILFTTEADAACYGILPIKNKKNIFFWINTQQDENDDRVHRQEG